MTTPSAVINIKAQGNHHALFLMLVALVIFILTFIFSESYWQQYRLVLIFIYLVALVTFITGLSKYLQPKYSLVLTPKAITYQHSNGQWQVTWRQIQAITLLKETLGLEQIKLPYIGIRLKDLDFLSKSISPRLANRLIHEQRPLIAFAISQGLLTFEQGQLNLQGFTLASGEIIKGPLAAFLHHCIALNTAFGCHLFIPETATDRELDNFHLLLNQCMKSAEQYD